MDPPLLVLHRAPLGTASNAAFSQSCCNFWRQAAIPPAARQALAPPGTGLHEKCCVNATWSAFLPLAFPHLSRNKAFPKILLPGTCPGLIPCPPLFGLALRQVQCGYSWRGRVQCEFRSRPWAPGWESQGEPEVPRAVPWPPRLPQLLFQRPGSSSGLASALLGF